MNFPGGPVSERLKILSVFFVFTLLYIFCYLIIRDHPLIIDERWYYSFVVNLIHYDFRFPFTWKTLSTIHSTLPTYDFLLAYMARFFRSWSLPGVRLYACALNFLSVPVIFLTARQMDPKTALMKTIQYSFLPILFPFFFLIYDDIFPLLFVVLSLFFALRNNYFACGAAMLAGMMVRQTNVVWAGFLFVFLYLREYGPALSFESAVRHLRRSWVFIVSFLLFIAFVILNHGVSCGEKTMHPVSFHWGNVYFFPFTYFFVFLPLNISLFPKAVNLLKSRWRIWAVLGVFFAIFTLTFKNDHPYNQVKIQFDSFRLLENQLLTFFTAGFFRKLIFFSIFSCAVLCMACVKFIFPEGYLIYPVSAVLFFGSWLVNPRYYFVSYALFILFRKTENARLERVLCAWFLIFSLLFFYSFSRDIFYA